MQTEPVQFRTLSGVRIDAPNEWQPALMELPAEVGEWQAAALLRNGEPLPVFQQVLAGKLRLLASWPVSGTGNYQLELRAGSTRMSQPVVVRPRKITESDYWKLLTDLQFRLPQAVALGLQKCGGLAGVELLPREESTYAEELARLRDAVLGCRGLPGLGALLASITKDPHQALTSIDPWVSREKARRPHPARLSQALARGGNLTEDRLPLRVVDSRVERTFDVYENQLLKAYCQEVELRLRQLLRVLGSGRARAEAQELLGQLVRACRGAWFLKEVSLPECPQTRPTMVLLKRPDYRAVLEGYLRLHRGRAVRLDTPLLETPLESLPQLYQLWCTLEVITALLEVAYQRGFRVQHTSLVQRDRLGFFVRILPNGAPVVVLSDPEKKRTLSLVPERTFAASGVLRSISAPQRPDITLWIQEAQGRSLLYLFDPKYRLESEAQAAPTEQGPAGEPKKQDTDKMHAYRDAIRDAAGAPAVVFAAILYPGKTVSFPATSELTELEPAPLAAISALPTQSEALQAAVQRILSHA